jgi:hypothetical protein
MVKKRRELARIDEMHDLGRKNAETLKRAHGWCKHLKIEMTSAGMLAGMSGLPIGSHDITCDHARGGISGLNLPWILPEFVVQNCRGCPSHSPNGDTEWGERVIAEHEAQVKEANERQAALARQLEEVRASGRKLARDAQGKAEFTVHRVLELTEDLFGEDTQRRSDAAALLQEAARIAPELFHEASVDIILGSAPQPLVADLCLPIAAALAPRRADLADRLIMVAVEAIERRLSIETACEILLRCDCGAARPIPGGVIERVIALQNHIRPFGGWTTRHLDCHLVEIPPSYRFSTALLGKAYDQDSEAVLTPLRAAFRDNNKLRRVNACGIVQELLQQRQAIGAALLPEIIDSLNLDDDPFDESADREACALIRTIFFNEPTPADELLRERFDGQSLETQGLTADVYQLVLRTEWNEKEGADRAQFDQAIGLAFRRCLALVQDQTLDLEVRSEFADAIESACRHYPDLAMAEFDTLLGALACLYTQKEAPPPPPRILLPGDASPDPRLQSLEATNRQMIWDQFKSKYHKCLEELASRRPNSAAGRLLNCFAGLDSKTHELLKAEVVSLLGEVGRDREILPQVLPLLWKAFMDYDSVLVRCYGIEAIKRCFESADCDPPPDIVEALLLHLRDRYVGVHDAAIRTIRWNTNWLAPSQAEDVIQQLAGWAATYRKRNPYKLNDICPPIVYLSRSVPALRFGAIRFIASLLPTGATYVDKDLIELLLRGVKPEENGAICVVPQVAAWLARDRRDPFDYHDGLRNQIHEWLQALPQETFQKTRGALLVAGRSMAKNGEIWSVYHLAATFASLGDFRAEAEVLGIAKAGLPQGRRYDPVIQILGELEEAAKMNEQLAGAE